VILARVLRNRQFLRRDLASSKCVQCGDDCLTNFVSRRQPVYFNLKLTIQFPHPVMKTGSSPTRRIVRKYVQLPTFKFSCQSRVCHPAQGKLRLDHLDTEPAND
jgi:hypothetical protein